MRIRLAHIIETSLASLFFLFAACSGDVFAQHTFARDRDQLQSRVGPGCSLVALELHERAEEGIDRFFTTDNFHWVELWVDYRPQRENERLKPAVFVTERHDFVVTQCDRDALELYDVSRNITVLFELDRMRWTYWNGLPDQYPRTANYHDIHRTLVQSSPYYR
jgi:hypothetical protein